MPGEGLNAQTPDFLENQTKKTENDNFIFTKTKLNKLPYQRETKFFKRGNERIHFRLQKIQILKTKC